MRREGHVRERLWSNGGLHDEYQYAVLAREWGVPNATPGRSVRCPAHEDQNPSLSIARDDSRAWCHASVCALHGPNGAGHDAYSLWQLAKGRAA